MLYINCPWCNGGRDCLTATASSLRIVEDPEWIREVRGPCWVREKIAPLCVLGRELRLEVLVVFLKSVNENRIAGKGAWHEYRVNVRSRY